jgi:hypothetical protein
MTDNAKLCRLCLDLLATTGVEYVPEADSSDSEGHALSTESDDSSINYIGYSYNATAHYLHTSAQRGCPLCAMVWDAVSALQPSLDPRLEKGGGLASVTCVSKVIRDDSRMSSLHEVRGAPPLYEFTMQYDKNHPLHGGHCSLKIYAFRVKSELIYHSMSIPSYRTLLVNYYLPFRRLSGI